MRFCLCLLVTLLPLASYGQGKMSVSEFRLNEKDIDANTEGTMERDQNGDKCALIKIKTTEKGFSFENGSLGVVKTDENKVAEVWVYLPQGSKRLDIKHPELGELNYEFPISIKKAKTYVMQLTTDKVFTATFDDSKNQKLILHITPNKAKVQINGSIENVENGIMEKEYSFGRYRYVVSADRYHSLEDTITINNPNAPHERYVNLKQAFGWIQFSNYKDLEDARLFVDNVSKGMITSAPVDLNSGAHIVKIIKPLYETYEDEITVQDSVTNFMSPQMIENYGEIALECVDKNAEIWVDGEQLATGTLTEKIGAGTHRIECRKQYHQTTTKEIVVMRDTKENYVLDAPIPICGTVSIKTGQVPASVVIDDGVGSAPSIAYNNDKVLIGPHKLIVRQKGYKTQTFDFTLAEGETFERDVVMEPIIVIHFQSKPEGANLYIDKEHKGTTPMDLEVKSGKHKVQISKSGYYDYFNDETLNVDGKTFSKNLKRIYYHKSDFYLEGFAQAGTFMAYGGAMGCDIYGFNMEAFYKGSLAGEETVYSTYRGNGDESTDYDEAPSEYQYKVKMAYGGKIGYAFNFHGRLRITPQVGGMLTSIEGTCDSSSDETTYVVSGLADLKFQLALAQNVSLTLCPEYSMALSKGKAYEKLEAVSSKIKGWGEGFNCSLGLNIYF